MQINARYKVESNELNYVLWEKVRPRKADSKERWVVDGYFCRIKELLKHLADKEVRGTGLKDFETVVKKQEELFTLIEDMCKNEFVPKVLEESKQGKRIEIDDLVEEIEEEPGKLDSLDPMCIGCMACPGVLPGEKCLNSTGPQHKEKEGSEDA
jgi:hypothetical protein